MSSIRDQLAAFIEVADAAFNKLALQQKSQIYVQVRLALSMCLCGKGGARL